jgi:transposase
MRRIKEVLRLKLELGLSDRQVAKSCSIARSTVSEYMNRAKKAGLSWPLPDDLDEGQLEERLFCEVVGGARLSRGQRRPQPDFKMIHNELRRHKNVTMQLLWEEYKEASPEGYQYSQFCDLYRVWSKKVDLVLRHSHRAGEKLFVDYAGQKVPIVDGRTGDISGASIFVAVMGASNYTYAEATAKQDLASWIAAHIRAFEFFGGCPAVIVPDNPKVGVIHPCWYEPELNQTYDEMAAYYGVAVMPARPRKPRDKAKVETGVLIVERWILAALRKRKFFGIGELNEAIAELLERLNQRPFRKLPGSRAELFATLDRPALRALPTQRYSFAEWKKATVNIDYHVELARHFYSVPYSLVGQKVELRYSSTTVEVLHRGVRVASHPRSHHVGGATTTSEHRPQSHQRYTSWTPSRLLEWAGKAGPGTRQVADSILTSRRFPEQAYRSCLGLIRLGERFGQQRLESACVRALKFQACSYKTVKSILDSGLDRQPSSDPDPSPPPLLHENIRGAEYFEDEKEGHHAN